MTVRELAGKINARVLTGDVGLDREVSGVYAGDLLSWVMSHAAKGDAWITVHTHMNIVAVALLTEVSCIILPEDISAEAGTLKKAEEENIPVLSTCLDGYHICCGARDCLDGRA